MSLRRLLPFILINILVSAGVVLAVLTYWEGRDLPDVRDIQAVPIVTETPVQTAFQFPEVTPQLETNTDTTGVQLPDDVELTDLEPTQRACPVTYVVQPGDSLLAIGEAFELFQADILTFNNISDANLLQVGQTLLLPCPEQLTPSPTPTPDPGVAPTPIPTLALAQADIQVSIQSVSGAGQLADEVVVIKNETADSGLKLLGWQIVDESGATFTFGNITVFDTINVFTNAGINDFNNIYWGSTEAVWAAGEQVTLYDAAGVQRAVYVVGQ